ncbi:hypothetical protein RUM43_000105 [Polyplax serrata]|uniref:Reverse transcriptase n=1 Tax=Polyplax serrata TaxID=468196 RepID=A0AAN8XRM9_POLSC
MPMLPQKEKVKLIRRQVWVEEKGPTPKKRIALLLMAVTTQEPEVKGIVLEGGEGFSRTVRGHRKIAADTARLLARTEAIDQTSGVPNPIKKKMYKQKLIKEWQKHLTTKKKLNPTKGTRRKPTSLDGQIQWRTNTFNCYLYKRSLTEDPTCPDCHEGNDTTYHLLNECPAWDGQRRHPVRSQMARIRKILPFGDKPERNDNKQTGLGKNKEFKLAGKPIGNPSLSSARRREEKKGLRDRIGQKKKMMARDR